MTTWVIASALGTLVGLIMALTGAGGGVLAVPLLIFGLQLNMHQAAPVALLAVGSTALLGALLGLREGVVRYRSAALIGGAAMLSAPLGVWLAQRLPQAPLLMAFSLVLGWTAWKMAALSQRPTAEAVTPPCSVNVQTGRVRWTQKCAWLLGATGVVSGLLTGLLGVGGGFVIVPSLTRLSNLDAKSISATSLAVISMATLSGLWAAVNQGQVNMELAAPFGLASILALLAGRRIALHLPAPTLRMIFAVVTVVVSVLVMRRGLIAW